LHQNGRYLSASIWIEVGRPFAFAYTILVWCQWATHLTVLLASDLELPDQVYQVVGRLRSDLIPSRIRQCPMEGIHPSDVTLAMVACVSIDGWMIGVTVATALIVARVSHHMIPYKHELIGACKQMKVVGSAHPSITLSLTSSHSLVLWIMEEDSFRRQCILRSVAYQLVSSEKDTRYSIR